QSTASLYAIYAREGGDRRTIDALRQEGAARLERLRGRGYDLGPPVAARIDAIYTQARQALYAVLDAGVVRDVAPRHVTVRTRARDREDYLAHPKSGESIRAEDAERIVSALASAGSRRPQLQIVISDGLNANAVNGQLRAVLPPLRRELATAGIHTGDVDVVIHNGRVRA